MFWWALEKHTLRRSVPAFPPSVRTKDCSIMHRFALLLWGMMAFAGLPAGWGQSPEDQIVRSASTVLAEAMSAAGNRIPQSMLRDAHGVAIIPNVVKGSFIVGARHGRGLLMVREPEGSWHAPVFVSLTGGNIGWQIGVQATDVVLVFKTQRSVEGILSGKFTIGADASAAAGPIGRKASA